MRINLECPVEPDHPSNQPSGSSSKKCKPNTNLLKVQKDDGVFRARLVSGSLRSLDTQKLRAEIVSLHLPGNPPAVMMSMRGMESLASSCLGAFAELSADLERIGGSLVLYNLPKEISKIMRKTKLDRIIQTAKARPQAKKQALAIKKKFAQSTQFRAA